MKRIYAFTLGLAALALLFAGPALAITVDLEAVKVNVTMPNTGEVIPMWTYQVTADPDGAVVPGDVLTIQAEAGDSLTINLTNNLDQGPGLVEPTSIVIPGQRATEVGAMVPTWTDGTTVPRGADLTKRVRSFTHEAAAGGSDSYTWGSLTAGTFLVQSGTHPQVQIQMGLYAVLLVDDSGQVGAEIHGQAFDSEQVMLFSEIDPVLHSAVQNDDYGPGKSVTSTIGYDPKYFLLNGVPYTEAGDQSVNGTPGDDILVRFLNAGLQTRVPQLLGAYMTLLAEDGNPVPFAKDLNSLVLPAAKTFDVLIENAQTPVPVFDRRVAHSTDQVVLPFAVLDPNGGEFLSSGGTFTIRWTPAVGAVSYRLFYFDADNTPHLIANVGNVTSYDWTVPTVVSPEAGKLIRVTAFDGPNGTGTNLGFDFSDAPFTITPPALAMVAPNGGESLTSGSVYNVQWNPAAGAASYRLFYFDADNTPHLIATVGNVTSYALSYPSVAPEAGKRLRVTAFSGPNGTGTNLGVDFSDGTFTINPNPALVRVISPNGGETLNSNTIYNVQWNPAAGAASYRLFYFDADNTPHLITNVGNVTSYDWTVPVVGAPEAGKRLRITAFDGPAGTGTNLGVDFSDGTFTIAP